MPLHDLSGRGRECSRREPFSIQNGSWASYDFDVNPILNAAFTPGTQGGANPVGVGVGARFTS
jgi:hypothetical protein